MKLNPLPAELLKWNNPPSSFETLHYHFFRISRWSANSEEPGQTAGMCRLAWLCLITLGSSRIKVNSGKGY